MKIWVDGDSISSKIIHWLLDNYAKTIIVSDIIHSKYGEGPQFVKLPQAEDAVDSYILNSLKEGDLVVTRDFYFAQRVLERKGLSINDRGLLFTPEYLKLRIEESQINRALKAGNQLPVRKKKGLSSEDFKNFISTVKNILEDLK